MLVIFFQAYYMDATQQTPIHQLTESLNRYMNSEITAVTTYARDRETGTRRAVTRSVIVETKSRDARKARDSRKATWALPQEPSASTTTPIMHATRDLTRMKAADRADTVSTMLLAMRHRPSQSLGNQNQPG